jgi:hypothetical protein
VIKSKSPSVELKGWALRTQSLGVPQFLAGQIGGISAHRETEVPEVHADLIGAASDGAGGEKGGAVLKALLNSELGECMLSILSVNAVGAEAAGFGADRCITGETI